MTEICRDILEYFMKEYTRYGSEWFLNKTMCPEKMLVYKKLAGMVERVHAIYHIALELEHGAERDAAPDAAMTPAAVRSAVSQPRPVT